MGATDKRQVNIHEAKTNFSRLVEAAENGEEIVIARAGKPVAKLVANEPASTRRDFGYGVLKGKIWIAPDFDDYDAEIERMFYGGDPPEPERE